MLSVLSSTILFPQSWVLLTADTSLPTRELAQPAHHWQVFIEFDLNFISSHLYPYVTGKSVPTEGWGRLLKCSSISFEEWKFPAHLHQHLKKTRLEPRNDIPRSLYMWAGLSAAALACANMRTTKSALIFLMTHMLAAVKLGMSQTSILLFH